MEGGTVDGWHYVGVARRHTHDDLNGVLSKGRSAAARSLATCGRARPGASLGGRVGTNHLSAPRLAHRRALRSRQTFVTSPPLLAVLVATSKRTVAVIHVGHRHLKVYFMVIRYECITIPLQFPTS